MCAGCHGDLDAADSGSVDGVDGVFEAGEDGVQWNCVACVPNHLHVRRGGAGHFGN